MRAFQFLLFISGVVIKAEVTDYPVDCSNPPTTPDKCDKLIEVTMATEDSKQRKVSYNNAYQFFCSSVLQKQCGASTSFSEDREKGETMMKIQVRVRGVMKQLYMFAELAQDQDSCAMIPAQVTPQVCASWLKRVSPSNSQDSVAIISAQQYVCLLALMFCCGVVLDSGPTTITHDKQSSLLLAIHLNPVDDPKFRKITLSDPQIVYITTELRHKSCVSFDSHNTDNCMQWLLQSKVTTDQQRLTPVDNFVCLKTLESNCGAKLYGYSDSSRDKDNPLVKFKIGFTGKLHADDHYGYTYLDTWKNQVGYALENDQKRK